MPIVTIQVTREGVTRKQKESLMRGATELLQKVLKKPPALTHVLIQEIDTQDWGVGGLPALKFRRKNKL